MAKGTQLCAKYLRLHTIVFKIRDVWTYFPIEESRSVFPSNIAEGFKRKTIREKCRYLNIAQSSLEECRYYLILAHDLDYGKTNSKQEQLSEVSKLLHSYYSTILNSDS